MKIKIVYIISHVDKALAFEWVAEHLDKDKFDLFFILLNPGNSNLEQFLRKNEIEVYRVYYKNKKNFLSALVQVRKILIQKSIQVVHSHLFDASLIGLLAAFTAGIKKRIHTRHNSTIHHNYFPKAVKYDKLINYLSSDIVAISEVVKKVLVQLEGVDEKKIHLIHHGFRFDDIPQKNSERVNFVRRMYNSGGRRPVIGVISRYIHWKGIQYIVPAYKKLLSKYPNALLILANAAGPFAEEMKQLLNTLPEYSYIEIPFEKDVFALYMLFDIFIHVPIDELSEAFGQTYIEAMSVGIPSVVTRSGIAHEIIKDNLNALVVDYKSVDGIYNAVIKLLSDDLLRDSISTKSQEDVRERFYLDQMIHKLQKLYVD
ncbi:MAG: glycosyltransferase family 4 protein [Candidatus Cyclobacteriaceae bacterium M2_1C_046]